MAWELHSYIVNPDDKRIYLKHVFYGHTKEECLEVKREHLASCEYYRAAEEEGRTDDEWEHIDAEDLPTVDGADDDVIDVGGGG
jgi:hypothetical protein